jgi:protein involved in polysaccharide export with SLBB domain
MFTRLNRGMVSSCPFSLVFVAATAAAMLLVSAVRDARAEYKLSPGDVVTFDFLDDAELPVSLTVASDGDVQFPLIGSVRLAGLTVPNAISALRKVYQAKEILKDPKIALNVTTFRPIFVLGEVKTPGSYPYYPELSVEQAIGLAGGVQTEVINPSDKIVTRARLRGEIDGNDVQIIHEAIYAARLAAQLEKRSIVDVKDVPEVARTYIQNVPLDSVIDIEQKILDTDLRTSKAQADILANGIKEAEKGLDLLAQLEKQQKEVVELNVQELERVTSLRKRELNTINELMRAKSSASNEKARLLEVYAEMSRSRRELGNLKLELAKLGADRENDILLKIQERAVAIKKLIAARGAAQEQYFLLSTAAIEPSDKNKRSFNYQVRRNTNGHREVVNANPTTEIMPGDVVIVSIAGM